MPDTNTFYYEPQHRGLELLAAFPPGFKPGLQFGLSENLDDKFQLCLDMDHAPLEGAAARDSVEAIASDRSIECWRYADSGAIDDAPTVIPEPRHSESALRAGWLQIAAVEPEDGTDPRMAQATHSVCGSKRSGTYRAAGIFASPEFWTPGAVWPDQAAAHSAIVREALTNFGDLAITDRPLHRQPLIGRRASKTIDGLACSWETGAALLGRLVRARQGRLPIARNNNASHDLYLTLAIHDLLPNLRPVIELSEASGRSADHALAFQRRVAQMLLARDDLASTSSDSQHTIKALDALDRVLIFTLAAFDELAHVVRMLAGIALPDQLVKLYKQEFLTEVAAREAPARLSRLFDPETRGASILEVLKTLRNTVHGVGLNSSTILTDGDDSTALAEFSTPIRFIPPGFLIQLRKTAFPAWGIYLADGRMFINSILLCEKIAFEHLRLLDRALGETAKLNVAPSPNIRSDAGYYRLLPDLQAVSGAASAPGALAAQFGLMPRRRAPQSAAKLSELHLKPWLGN